MSARTSDWSLVTMMLHLQLACILLLCIQGAWSHEGPEISVGDTVIVGDVSAGETACVTARNREGEGEGEGTYQVDYQDGETSDETVAGEELTLAISHTKADCRNGGRGGGGRGAGLITQGGQGGHPAPLASRLYRIPTHFLLSLHGI